jgi:hypothetical protein
MKISKVTLIPFTHALKIARTLMFVMLVVILSPTTTSADSLRPPHSYTSSNSASNSYQSISSNESEILEMTNSISKMLDKARTEQKGIKVSINESFQDSHNIMSSGDTRKSYYSRNSTSELYQLLSNMRAQAELYYSTTNNSYGAKSSFCNVGMFGAPSYKQNGLQALVQAAKKQTTLLSCNSTPTAFAISAKIRGQKGAFYCVDSSGYIGPVSRSLKKNETSCAGIRKISHEQISYEQVSSKAQTLLKIKNTGPRYSQQAVYKIYPKPQNILDISLDYTLDFPETKESSVLISYIHDTASSTDTGQSLRKISPLFALSLDELKRSRGNNYSYTDPNQKDPHTLIGSYAVIPHNGGQASSLTFKGDSAISFGGFSDLSGIRREIQSLNKIQNASGFNYKANLKKISPLGMVDIGINEPARREQQKYLYALSSVGDTKHPSSKSTLNVTTDGTGTATSISLQMTDYSVGNYNLTLTISPTSEYIESVPPSLKVQCEAVFGTSPCVSKADYKNTPEYRYSQDIARQATVQQTLSSMRAQAELYYSNNIDSAGNYGYGLETSSCSSGIFADQSKEKNGLGFLIDSLKKDSKLSVNEISCKASSKAWTVRAKIPHNSKYYCVDSVGSIKEVSSLETSLSTLCEK